MPNTTESTVNTEETASIIGELTNKEEELKEEKEPIPLTNFNTQEMFSNESQRILLDALKVEFISLIENEKKKTIDLQIDAENLKKTLQDSKQRTEDMVNELFTLYEDRLNQVSYKIISTYENKLKEANEKNNEIYKSVVTNANQNYNRMIKSIDNNYKVLFSSYSSPFKLIQYGIIGLVINLLFTFLLFIKIF